MGIFWLNLSVEMTQRPPHHIAPIILPTYKEYIGNIKQELKRKSRKKKSYRQKLLFHIARE
jgi:hypothetical protein